MATEIVDALLQSARAASASDVHLVPTSDRLQMLWRLDGVLNPVAMLDKSIAANIVARLKVLANLLTYQTDVPQEGRIQELNDESIEMRLSTFPTVFGEKAVIRMFVGSGRYRRLADLGLASEVRAGLNDLLLESGGVILVCGPAGSGKTTTIYACLRELVDNFGPQRSLVSLEDPIEAIVPGVAQSQISAASGFDYETGLKSLLRQDPEVIVVGEIRDRVTAETVFQAALTGHLVVTTFHAGSAAEGVCRLSDLGIEPYLLRTGLLGIVAQRLVRKLCVCSRPSTDEADRFGFDLEQKHVQVPVGCGECRGTGYKGRMLLAEFLKNESSELGRAILSRQDSSELEQLAIQSGMKSRWEHARQMIVAGQTSPAEIRRVLGTR